MARYSRRSGYTGIRRKVVEFIKSLLLANVKLETAKFDDTDITNFDLAKQAGEKMTELAKTIPKVGFLQAILGLQDIGLFGTSVLSYITALKDANEKLETAKFSTNSVRKFDLAKQAGEKMNDLMKLLPTADTFGASTSLIDVGTFGDKMKIFVTKLTEMMGDIGEAEHLDKSTYDKADYAVTTGLRLITLINSIPDDVKDGETFKNGMKNIGEGLKKFSENISKITQEQVSNSVDNIQNLVQILKDISGIDMSSVQAFSDALNSISVLMSGNFIAGFNAQIPSIIQAVEGIMNGIINVFSTLPDQFSTISYDSCVSIVNMMNYCMPAIYNVGKSLGQSLYKGFNEISTDFVKLPSNLVRGAINGLEDPQVIKALGDACTALSKIAASSLSNYDRFYTSGINTAQGFIDGMNHMYYSVALAAYSIGWQAVSSLNQAIDAHSPAKATKLSGGFFGDGFIIGIESKMKEVTKISANMGTESVKILKDSISRISDAFDSDMDLSPTITPVLDLSEIQNGIGLINGYLSNQAYSFGSVTGAIARNLSVGTMGVSSNNVYNDSKVIAAIDSLGERVDGLSDSMSKMQLVLDSGELVGGISEKMNTRFGHMQNEAIRGIR